jgi:site-specific DNA-methyltransferase (adenine-specific)
VSSIQILNADAFDLPLDTFECFDAMITDPPYSPHVHENMASMGSDGAGPRQRDPGFDPLSHTLQHRIVQAAARVKRWSVVFSDIQGLHQWDTEMARAKLEAVRAVWVRWSQPQLSGDRPPSGCEMVNLYHRPGRKHWNGPGNTMCFENRCLRGREKHPTEKPIDLILDLVSWFSDPGEAVVDVCAGACTTALACRILGRDCVAIERDETWARVGEFRCKSPLSLRDLERAREWCVKTKQEAESVPTPKAADGSDVKTWERAQRRLADVARALEWL